MGKLKKSVCDHRSKCMAEINGEVRFVGRGKEIRCRWQAEMGGNKNGPMKQLAGYKEMQRCG